MKNICVALIIAAGCVLPSMAQHRHGPGRQQNPNDMMAKMKEEAAAYYAGADTADYGVRYRFKYKFNKEHDLGYEEDRVVLVRPEVTLDMSYEGIGETRWRQAHPDSQGGDMSLAYHLTPSYYFYYPESGRSVKTYRIIAEEFLLNDSTGETNKWNITSEKKRIGDYECRKATLDKDGRRWTAWFTNDLPHKAAPRTLTGLPGVVLEVSDADGEVRWLFNGIVENLPDSKLYVKFPDKFTTVPAADFPKIVKLFGRSSNSTIQDSGIMDKYPGHYPEKYRPSTGIDGLNIDNPIER